MTENGKLSLARVFENGNGEQLQLELPQLRMSAELQGINASFPNVLLDESCYQMRDTVEGILASPTEIVGVELPPASVKLNLLPESWRRRRSQLIRQAEWRKRLVWIGGAYVALLFFLLAYLGLLRFEIGRLDARIAHDAPGTEFVRATEANWKAWRPRLMRVITRSKFCCISLKACRRPMCALRRTTSRRGRFPSMAKRTRLLWLTNSSKR